MHKLHKHLSLEKNGELMFKENILNFKPISNGKVRVQPLNVGVCSSDIPRCFDKKAYSYPLVIGHEFMVKVLDDPSNKFKVGQRLAVFPLKPCFKCNACKTFEYNKCSSYSYYGSRTAGGMQSWLDIDLWNLIPIPDEMDDISGSLLEPIAVCVHTAKILERNVNILLYGGGFLSQILSQILIEMECNITCIERNEYKKEYFNDAILFLSKSDDLNDSSFDYSIECCGANGVINECIRLTKANGKIVQLANPSSDLKFNAKSISNLMRKEQTLIGTWNSSFRPDKPELCDFQKSIKMITSKKINIKNLISHSIKIEDAVDLINQIYLRRKNKNALPKYNKCLVEIS